jgi:hypothetical protein
MTHTPREAVFERLRRLARALQTTTDHLLGLSDHVESQDAPLEPAADAPGGVGVFPVESRYETH